MVFELLRSRIASETSWKNYYSFLTVFPINKKHQLSIENFQKYNVNENLLKLCQITLTSHLLSVDYHNVYLQYSHNSVWHCIFLIQTDFSQLSVVWMIYTPKRDTKCCELIDKFQYYICDMNQYVLILQNIKKKLL